MPEKINLNSHLFLVRMLLPMARSVLLLRHTAASCGPRQGPLEFSLLVGLYIYTCIGQQPPDIHGSSWLLAPLGSHSRSSALLGNVMQC